MAGRAFRTNHVELAGSVASVVDRRETPAGTPVASFRLKVDADPEEEAVAGCTIRVVVLSRRSPIARFEKGAKVELAGALAERRWKGPGGTQETRYEILARELLVIDPGAGDPPTGGSLTPNRLKEENDG